MLLEVLGGKAKGRTTMRLTTEQIEELKRQMLAMQVAVVSGERTYEIGRYHAILSRHAPALLDMARELEKLENERDRWRAVAEEREDFRPICTHCATRFPKGREGVELFKLHIAGCNSHPLHPMAKQIARLHEILAEVHQELSDRYDGAPDSPTRWMGELMDRCAKLDNRRT